MKPFQDIFGNDLVIGDTVAFNPPTYKGLVRGKIVGFTPKNVRICWSNGGLTRQSFCTRLPNDCVKAV